MNFHLIKSRINHWLDATNEHSIHSPFFFDLYKEIISQNATKENGEESSEKKIHHCITNFLQAKKVVIASKKQLTVYTSAPDKPDVFQNKRGHDSSFFLDFIRTERDIDFFILEKKISVPDETIIELISKCVSSTGVVMLYHIHHSKGTEEYWNQWRNYPLVSNSVDLFRYGLLFYDTSLNFSHYLWEL